MAHPIKHFRTITRHRHKVIANCARAGILRQGLIHDLSKYSPTEFILGAKQIENVEMPVKYVIEMFCDRVAASKIYNGKNYTDGAPFTYFCRIRGKHRMHPNTEALLEKLLVMLRDEGEEKTFAYIRSMKK